MACLAALDETSTVRIAVAIRALTESNAGVSGLAVRPGCVTLLASHLGVQSSQRVACLGMVELAYGDRLPVVIGVALQAVRTQATLVLVFVAGDAVRGQSQEGSGEIFDLDPRPLGWSNVLWSVALVTGQAGVFALERVSALLVVEGPRVPLDEREVFPVVVRVAAHTFLAGARRHVVSGMQSLVCREPGSNLPVAVQAFEGSLSRGQLVTAGAVAGAAQGLVRTRQGSG